LDWLCSQVPSTAPQWARRPTVGSLTQQLFRGLQSLVSPGSVATHPSRRGLCVCTQALSAGNPGVVRTRRAADRFTDLRSSFHLPLLFCVNKLKNNNTTKPWQTLPCTSSLPSGLRCRAGRTRRVRSRPASGCERGARPPGPAEGEPLGARRGRPARGGRGGAACARFAHWAGGEGGKT
jgi:hypothetical protein